MDGMDDPPAAPLAPAAAPTGSGPTTEPRPEPFRQQADRLINSLFAAGLDLHGVEAYLRHHSSETDLDIADRVRSVIDLLDRVIVGIRSAALSDWADRDTAHPLPRG